MKKNIANLRGFWPVMVIALLGISRNVKASDIAHRQATAACISRSLKLGSPQSIKAYECYREEAEQLAKIRVRRKKQLGVGLDADMRTRVCRKHFVIDQVALVEEESDTPEPKLSKSYLERFQKRLIPYGKRIADCHASLAKGVIAPKAFRRGRLMIELEVGIDGRAKQVLLTEESALDGHVAGCVVRELCGFWVSPPPGGTSIYLELPFTFKRPKGLGVSTSK